VIEDLAPIVHYVAGLGNQNIDVESRLKLIQDQILQLEEPINRLRDRVNQVSERDVDRVKAVVASSTEVIAKGSETLQQLKKSQQDIHAGLRKVGMDIEWLSLHNALAMIEAPTSPYATLVLLMGALQATGIGSIWIMIQFKEMMSVTGLVFASLVFCTSTYALWLDFKMNGYLHNLNSFQIAAMIREIRAASLPSPRQSGG
jgi:hypothetical protein